MTRDGVAGSARVSVALPRRNRTVIHVLLPRGHARVVALLGRKRRLRRGPSIVAIAASKGKQWPRGD